MCSSDLDLVIFGAFPQNSGYWQTSSYISNSFEVDKWFWRTAWKHNLSVSYEISSQVLKWSPIQLSAIKVSFAAASHCWTLTVRSAAIAPVLQEAPVVLCSFPSISGAQTVPPLCSPELPDRNSSRGSREDICGQRRTFLLCTDNVQTDHWCWRSLWELCCMTWEQQLCY